MLYKGFGFSKFKPDKVKESVAGIALLAKRFSHLAKKILPIN